MTSFLGTLFWALLALAQFIAGLLIQAFMCVLWFFWPIVLVGVLIASAQSAEAGWFSWLWGSDTRQLERSLDVAQEAARVASQAVDAQAQQAAAQASQNARLAETLGQLSSERSNLADHLHALTELGLKDSQWAAAINASGPVMICVTVLAVAGLALWLANRSGDGKQHAELAETVDLLVEEITAYRPEGELGTYGAGRLVGSKSALSPRSLARLSVLAGHGDEGPDLEDPGSEYGPEYGPDDADPEAANSGDDSGPMPF